MIMKSVINEDEDEDEDDEEDKLEELAGETILEDKNTENIVTEDLDEN